MRLPKKLAEKIVQAGTVGPAVNLPRGKRRNKYRNVPTVVDGIRFDSKKEAARYVQLRAEQQAGLISGLRLQKHSLTTFVLRVNGKIVCRYVADFVYIRNGERVVEDVKGRKTPVYLLKKKLMKAIHGIEIHET